MRFNSSNFNKIYPDQGVHSHALVVINKLEPKIIISYPNPNHPLPRDQL